MMDDDARRLAELENQVEELEKNVGRLTFQLQNSNAELQTALDCIADLRAEYRTLCRTVSALAKRTDTLECTTEEFEKTVSALSEDVDETIEDMNLLSDEMRRRWQRFFARQERFFWDAAEMQSEDAEDDEA